MVTALVEVLDLPESGRLKAARAIDERLQRIPRTHLLTRMFMPALARCSELELRAVAHVRAARAALAVERFRNKTGRLPAGLDDLVPQYLQPAPADPFTGGPIKYRQLAKGYVVYSVGPDLSDDGGRERPTDRKAREAQPLYDITFVVER